MSFHSVFIGFIGFMWFRVSGVIGITGFTGWLGRRTGYILEASGLAWTRTNGFQRAGASGGSRT